MAHWHNQPGVSNGVSSPDEVQRTRVKICGDEYVLKGQAEPDYMTRLAAVVDRKMREVLDANPHLPRHRAAILAAIHLADELERAKRENAELLELLEEAKER